MAVQRNTAKPRAPIVGSAQIRGHSVLPQKSHAAPWGCGEAPKAYVNLLTDICIKIKKSMVILDDLKFLKVSALQQWPWFSKRNLDKTTRAAL